MSTTLYIEPNSGIAGDMFAGAVINLLPDKNILLNALNSLSIKNEFEINIETVSRNNINATLFSVIVKNDTSHGRTLAEIKSIINQAYKISNNAKTLAVSIFQRLAKAEAKIHGKHIDKIHFHEVGAIDAIVDIVTASIAIDILKPNRILSIPTTLGTGTTNSAHGTIPIPSPATLEILSGKPVTHSNIESELTTPTGAAILAEIVNEWNSNFEGICIKTGYGAGTRILKETANILRLSLYRNNCDTRTHDSKIAVIKCNIDDMPGEHLSYIGKELLSRGAIDYTVIPATMKKSRQGFILEVLCNPDELESLADFIIHNTSTLGIRYHINNRKTLERKIQSVDTPFGKINVKIALDNNKEILKYKPEQKDIERIAKEYNLNYYQAANKINSLLETILKNLKL